jgi:Fe-S cluster biogenesis protein NfuA
MGKGKIAPSNKGYVQSCQWLNCGQTSIIQSMIPLRSRNRSQGIEARISAILIEVEPLLRMDHCRLELVEFSADTGVALLAIAGGCPDCDVSPATFSAAIQAHIMMRVPEVREVRISC